MNPLLDFSGLPQFEKIKPEHVSPAINQLISECRELVLRLTEDREIPTWDDFVLPMEDAHERLSRAWGPVGHLNAVMNSPGLRAAYNETLPVITQYYAELGQNLALFEKFKALKDSPEFESLSGARRKIIENELRDFRLGGAELPDEKKARLLEIQERLSELSSRFSDNLLDATNAFELRVEDKEELSGLPEDVLQAANMAAGGSGWLFTLKAPSYMPVMQFADNRAMREKMYRAYVTRASEFGKPEWDNSPLMEEIIALRGEEAGLLGFANYGELSLASKMAKTPEQVIGFMRELARRSRPFAERDLAEVREFASVELGMEEMHAWDFAYASEKLRERRYAFSEQEVKEYFPEDAVLSGLFRLVGMLYGLQISESSAPVWHESVRFFDIRSDGRLVGQFYFDLYARSSKRGGAWMDDAISRRKKDGKIQTPVAYMTCNFSAPVGNKPALFTHDEVITLFHEFGHGLHHLLTEVDEIGVSGINGVEWDAVELPSQFMENFCWEWEVLSGMTRHVETSKPLPRTLFDKMLAAKNFQSGLQSLRQIEFAMFDMLMHSAFEPGGSRTILQLLDEVRAEVAVLMPPEYNRFPNSFSHIFAGGYGAGYYSYKWAEVLSSDAYSLFEEQGVLNPVTGAKFRSEILAVGGSRDAMQSFVSFRGREPTIDALLRHNGLTGHA